MAVEEIPLKERKEAFYRSIFDKYDVDHNGSLNVGELETLIVSREYHNDIPLHVIRQIHKVADKNRDERIDFNEFMEMVQNKNLQYIFGHYVSTYVHLVSPKRGTAAQIRYEDDCYCCPPPLGMLVISLIEIIFFAIDAKAGEKTDSEVGSLGTIFIYNPQRRREIWRFITYMFVHIGVVHLIVNILVQIFLGVTLEIIHRWWRVLLIYFAGVLAGSLATSIVHPNINLAGASGGVYALMTAHLATIILNWHSMTFPGVQLLVFLVVIATDVGVSIQERYVFNTQEPIGYTAHLAGGIAGLLVGLNVLRNFEVTKVEKIVWWVSMITFTLLIGTAVVCHLTLTNYFPKQI